VESRTNNNLSTQPDDILKEIAKNPATIINLSKSSQRCHTFFSQTQELQLASECLRQLLNHAALGEWIDAECMWKLFPDLLTSRGTVYFPNRTYVAGQAPVDIPVDQHPGRYKYVNCTAWQIALMNEEWEMAEEMAKYMDGEEKQKQFAEVFPNGEIKCHLDLEKAKGLLEAVFNAVIHDASINGKHYLDNMNQSTQEALDAIYAYVRRAPEHKTGLVFDTHIYIAALKLYEDKFGQFQNWKKNSFWCVRIEEHLASLLGTGYLRHHAQGIMNQVTLSGCTLTNNSSIHPFRRPSNSIPGFHFFVGIYGAGGGGWQGSTWGARVGVRSAARVFKTYVKQKQEQGTEFTRQYFATTHRLI
jgi:hypothetical protein